MINEQVLLGSLLGDGSLSIRPRGRNPVFSEMHSINQLDYLKWKNQFLKFRFTIEKRIDKRFYTQYNQCRIISGARSELWNYYNMFYPNGKKIISKEILKKLDLLAIAVWFCDDGSYDYQNGSIRIATDCFGKKGNQLIIQHMKQIFKFDFTIIGRRLYLTVAQTRQFVKMIEDIVPESMQYKLGKDLTKRKKQKEKNIIAQRIYWQKNRNKLIISLRKNYLKNREKRLTQQKNYYIRNKKKILAQKREYRMRIKEKATTTS